MKKYFSLCFTFLFSLITFTDLAQANIGGKWQGTGEWKYDGSSIPCYDIQLILTEDENQLSRKLGHFDCDYVTLDAPPLDIQKVGPNLVIDGNQIGSYENNKYFWNEDYSERVKIKVNIQRVENHLDYAELWYDAQDVLIYDIKARLKLK